MTRKEMKKNARKVIKKHYLLFLMTCLLLGFVGVEYTESFSALKLTEEDISVVAANDDVTEEELNEAYIDTQVALAEGEEIPENPNVETTVRYSNGLLDILHVDTSEGSRFSSIFGKSRGVLSGIVNGKTSGKMYVVFLDAASKLVNQPGIAEGIIVFLSLLFTVFFWALFKNMFIVIARRIFLEAKIYSKVPYTRFLYFFYIKRWLHTAWVVAVWQIRETLWWITIIGGIIKNYSYAMVPYIVCEYPDIKANEAIKLSIRMMKGHKWELFKLHLSFIGWYLLSGVTWGLSSIFFLNPYMAATEVEFYTEMRRQAKEKNIPGSELLQDNYLFEAADPELLQGAYAGAVELYSQPRVESEYLKGIKGFIAKATSIVLFIDKDVRAVEKVRNEKVRLRRQYDCATGAAYPDRLSPIPDSQHRRWVNNTNYNRYYSIWSIVMMFIIFCFIGWCWEVSLHIIQDGTFVNRGMLHGPWIPIYGSGGVLILAILTRLRKYPVAEFVAAIVLCGFVEYMTSYFVELSKGKRWWDYTGYFLNLDGRICAEGLLVFGVMGMVIVYAVAPLLDHYLRRIPAKVIIPLSIVLMTLFAADSIYSGKHPNEGKGITDYTAYTEEESR